MDKLKNLLKKYDELVRYVLFGILTAGVNWTVYIIMINLLRVDLGTVNADDAFFEMLEGNSGDNIKRLCVCTLTAWLANVIAAFITNKLWVFKSEEKTPVGVLREFGEFFAAHIFTGMLEWCGIPLLVMAGLKQSIFGVEGALAKIVISIAVLILNFVFSKLIVFRKRKTNE